jgi:hypothetical protein
MKTERPKGIPRTAKAAAKRGFQKSKKVNFDKLSDVERKDWVHLDHIGARVGSICAIRKQADGTCLICFLDANGECGDCHVGQCPD